MSDPEPQQNHDQEFMEEPTSSARGFISDEPAQAVEQLEQKPAAARDAVVVIDDDGETD